MKIFQFSIIFFTLGFLFPEKVEAQFDGISLPNISTLLESANASASKAKDAATSIKKGITDFVLPKGGQLFTSAKNMVFPHIDHLRQCFSSVEGLIRGKKDQEEMCRALPVFYKCYGDKFSHGEKLDNSFATEIESNLNATLIANGYQNCQLNSSVLKEMGTSFVQESVTKVMSEPGLLFDFAGKLLLIPNHKSFLECFSDLRSMMEKKVDQEEICKNIPVFYKCYLKTMPFGRVAEFNQDEIEEIVKVTLTKNKYKNCPLPLQTFKNTLNSHAGVNCATQALCVKSLLVVAAVFMSSSIFA